jgi:hypothetical protein
MISFGVGTLFWISLRAKAIETIPMVSKDEKSVFLVISNNKLSISFELQLLKIV